MASVPLRLPFRRPMPFRSTLRLVPRSGSAPLSVSIRFVRQRDVFRSVPRSIPFRHSALRPGSFRVPCRLVACCVPWCSVAFRLLPSSLLCPFVLFRLAPSCSGIAAGPYVSPLILAEIETQQLATVANLRYGFTPSKPIPAASFASHTQPKHDQMQTCPRALRGKVNAQSTQHMATAIQASGMYSFTTQNSFADPTGTHQPRCPTAPHACRRPAHQTFNSQKASAPPPSPPPPPRRPLPAGN